MSTQIVPVQREESAAVAVIPRTFSLDEMKTMAVAIAKSQLCGVRTAEQALTLMIVADAEGLHPGIVARDYHIINGRATRTADSILARFLDAGGSVEWHQYTDACVSATFRHPRGGEVHVDWDEQRVKQAGLGGNHQKYPRAMKRARCISEGVRTVFPAACSGAYTPEEAVDFEVSADAAPAPRQAADAPDAPADQQPTNGNGNGRRAATIRRVVEAFAAQKIEEADLRAEVLTRFGRELDQVDADQVRHLVEVILHRCAQGYSLADAFGADEQAPSDVADEERAKVVAEASRLQSQWPEMWRTAAEALGVDPQQSPEAISSESLKDVCMDVESLLDAAREAREGDAHG